MISTNRVADQSGWTGVGEVAFAPPATMPAGVGVAEVAAMRYALDLAWAGVGLSSPNPPVACVILDRSGIAVGAGHTQPAGQAHAEVIALRQAGARAVGGTAVVTLEPCRDTGRTRPCTRALVEAGISRVVYAVDDPTVVAGGGAAWLRVAGINVVGGLYAELAAAGALRFWLHRQSTGRPYVTWKFAASLDGRATTSDGGWLTGIPARADVQALRAHADVVLVGSGTVLADDPHLTVRGLPADQPLRAVADRRHRTSPTARIHTGPGQVLVLDDPDPASMLLSLRRRGMLHVWLEGGPRLAASFLRAGLIDRIIAYLTPRPLGTGYPTLASPADDRAAAPHRELDRLGTPAEPDAAIGLDALAGLGVPPGRDVRAGNGRWSFTDIRMVGEDLRITTQRSPAVPPPTPPPERHCGQIATPRTGQGTSTTRG